MKKKNRSIAGDPAVVGSIFEAYFNDPLPLQLNEEIFEWFVAYGHLDHIDRPLLGIYLRGMEQDDVADSHTIEGYRDICRRLGFPEPEETSSLKQPAPAKRKLITTLPFKIAAVVIPFIFLASVLLLRTPSSVPPMEDYLALTVGSELQQRIELPDGSQIWVNTDSHVDCKGNNEQGWDIYLEGEAYFSVTPGRPAPFRVITEKLTVEVQGTEFNVAAYKGAGQVEVVLVKGSVKVAGLPGRAGQVTLLPGQKISFGNETSDYVVAPVEGWQIPEWKVDALDFEDASLERIIRSAGIYFGKNIQTHGHIDLGEHFTLKFTRQMSIGDIMEILREMSGGFDYTLEGDTVKLYSIVK